MAADLFNGDPPSRETYVLGQAVAFNPRQWLDRLPEAWQWPPVLPNAPGDSWPTVSRREVFRLAKPTSPTEAVHLYVAACAWGAGLKSRNVARRVRVLRENGEVGEQVLAALALVRGEGAARAYKALHRGGEHRLKHLGPGFFTKLLYFGGYDLPTGGLRPLILDQYVARALNEQADFGWRLNWQWTAAQYERYLAAAHGWAETWAGGTDPDVVERVLFERGKVLAGMSR